MVVSEIGEQWSPQTAPERHAAMEITSISPVFALANNGHTIGIKIPKVPQLVPVENARNTATKNMIAGRNIFNAPAEFATIFSTKTLAPNKPVIPDKVHANVRIRIGATIALKPSGIQFVNSLKVITPRII